MSKNSVTAGTDRNRRLHEALVDRARRYLDEVFEDRSVDQSVTRASLQDLRDHIDISLESLHAEADE